MRNLHKGKYKDMKKYLATLYWNNMLRNKTATECWNILRFEIESIVDQFVPMKKQGNRFKKKHFSKEAIRKIGVQERMKTTPITKRHLMQLELKSDNLKEGMSKH